jgi:phosphomethylpyrimidine synthase
MTFLRAIPFQAVALAKECMCGPHFCFMKITEDVRIYAAEQNVSDADALELGMAERSKAFRRSGGEIYAEELLDSENETSK